MGYVETNLMPGEEVTYRALVWLVQWVKSRTSEFAVTKKRVIIKVGLVRLVGRPLDFRKHVQAQALG